jgi:Holliday junction resolvasome RuvABC endonuclease subunit
MRVVGIDYASRGYSGLALAVDGEPVSASTFKTDAHLNESDAAMLREYEHWLHFKLKMLKPDVAAVERLSVFQSKTVIRALSHREAVCLLVAKRHAKIVVHYTPSQARAVVFQNGKISKDNAWEQRDKFIKFDFGQKTKGGADKLDAMTQALAAPILLERGK